MIVRCTKKMLDLLGGRSVAVGEFPATDDDWYLDLIWFDRRKCLLLVHAGTLFPVFRADVRSPRLRPPGHNPVPAVQAELATERLPLDMFGPLQPDDVHVARTASRSILGFMNQMTHEVRYQVMRADDVRNCDIDALKRQLRRTLRNHGGYVRPIDLVTKHCAPLAAPTQPAGAPKVTGEKRPPMGRTTIPELRDCASVATKGRRLPVTQTSRVDVGTAGKGHGSNRAICRCFVSGAAQESNLPTVGYHGLPVLTLKQL